MNCIISIYCIKLAMLVITLFIVWSKYCVSHGWIPKVSHPRLSASGMLGSLFKPTFTLTYATYVPVANLQILHDMNCIPSIYCIKLVILVTTLIIV